MLRFWEGILIYAEICSLFTWVWTLKPLFIFGRCQKISAGHSASQYVWKERPLDAKRWTPGIRQCNSQPQKLNLFIHLYKKNKKKSVVIFKTLLLIPLNSTVSFPTLFSSVNPMDNVWRERWKVWGQTCQRMLRLRVQTSCLVSHTDPLQGFFESVVGSLTYRGLLNL